mmetsp:Transcript_25684/g.59664  ORF Transcript_25684/g.59664 Transcript_25684/m.59664 type:complete len:103 (+) Transcript_25684:107-415(+)
MRFYLKDRTPESRATKDVNIRTARTVVLRCQRIYGTLPKSEAQREIAKRYSQSCLMCQRDAVYRGFHFAFGISKGANDKRRDNKKKSSFFSHRLLFSQRPTQ